MIEKYTFNSNELPKIVNLISEKIKNCKIVTFTGPLGAGKTTIISMLLKKQGIKEDILSPTFTYVNIYKNDAGKTFYHFDLYRIQDTEDFLMMGFDEYLREPNSQVFIEWPQTIKSLLNESVCHISLDYGKVINERLLEIENLKV